MRSSGRVRPCLSRYRSHCRPRHERRTQTMTTLRSDNVPKPRVERSPLLAPSSKAARQKQRPAKLKDRIEEAGEARFEPQNFARSARAATRTTSATMRSDRCSACTARGVTLWRVAGLLVCASCRAASKMACAPQPGRRPESDRRKAARREGTPTAATEDVKGIAWAARQGANDQEAGTACPRYKNFLRIYNLPKSQFTLRMWNAYLPASQKKKPVRRNTPPSKPKHAPRWPRGITLGDAATPRHRAARRYDLVMPRRSDLSPENAALLRKVNQLDTLVDMWR
jgi:hypothetical protein